MNIYTFAVYRPFVLSDAKKVELELDDDTTLDIKLDSTIQIYNGIKIESEALTNEDGEDKPSVVYKTGKNIQITITDAAITTVISAVALLGYSVMNLI